MAEGPDLSAVLVTDRWETIRRTVDHLRSQTARERLELVVVAPPGEALDGDGLADFRWTQRVDADTLASLYVARAAGVRAAQAPVVAFTESHAYPDPGWAEALIETHCGPWGAVGPVMRNGNPQHAASWGNHFVNFGFWLDPLPAGSIERLPAHNTSYKRSLLLDFGEDLPRMLQSETELQWRLRSAGHDLYFEPAAKTAHENMVRRLPSTLDAFDKMRVFGAMRAEGWSAPRRVAYAGGLPLIFAIRLRQVLRDVRRSGRGHELPAALPMVLAALGGGVAGEAVGYLTGRTGADSAVRRQVDYELHGERLQPSTT